jgi:2-phospho-L-lactate guanylyltransferase
MTIWAIVPVKPFLLGKSRLAGTLSGDERAFLNRAMLEHTLQTLRSAPEIDQTMVVSRDPEVLAIAREFNARTVQEHGTSHLNLALTRATAVAKAFEVRSVLVLPADLPLLDGEDIKQLIGLAGNAPSVVIAPDRHNDGTNALLVSPAGMISYDFGPQSFGRHCAHATQMGARLEIVRRPTLGLDLDRPDDLDLYEEMISKKQEAS